MYLKSALRQPSPQRRLHSVGILVEGLAPEAERLTVIRQEMNSIPLNFFSIRALLKKPQSRNAWVKTAEARRWKGSGLDWWVMVTARTGRRGALNTVLK